MIHYIQAEVIKIISKPRSYIGLAAISVIVGLIHLAMYLDGEGYISFITAPAQTSFTLEGNILNGNLVCFIILQTLILQIPLLVALVTGDLVSGEAAMGTIRLILTRPMSRSAILFAKFSAGAFYVFLLLLFLGVIALGGGLFLFGQGDLIVLKSEELTILAADDTFWRFIAALGVAFLSLLVVAALSLWFSCLADNSIGPIITTMAVIILFTIIGTIDVPLFDRIKPFLFTTHMVIWRNMFDQPLDRGMIFNSISILGAHLVGFYAAAWWTFTRKDIKS